MNNSYGIRLYENGSTINDYNVVEETYVDGQPRGLRVVDWQSSANESNSFTKSGTTIQFYRLKKGLNQAFKDKYGIEFPNCVYSDGGPKCPNWGYAERKAFILSDTKYESKVITVPYYPRILGDKLVNIDIEKGNLWVTHANYYHNWKWYDDYIPYAIMAIPVIGTIFLVLSSIKYKNTKNKNYISFIVWSAGFVIMGLLTIFASFFLGIG